jgi:hypothetical protein
MNILIARQLLANMPDEVFSLYIEPLIELHGWPFTSLDDPPSRANALWLQMFDHQSVKSISQLSWERHEIPFSFRSFHPVAQQVIAGLVNQHVGGLNTPYANVLNTKARFASCRSYIAHTGRMPAPVILMQDWKGLRILDGNHRLAAMASFSSATAGIVDCWIGST